ncbi:helix-turn-helix domain-containing protein [Curtobacterium sp. VKM Ac-1395]|uniref:helix-turn-helix domain-containing protein n=1 Tax=Curtobacterium sp. VKM Ac-1395 TaxID=2783815 RepID=UPI001889FAD5|nr:helix-turn-helix transcriptional regulator [Curtobacterium sp. VKM Ac-1395]MBF4591259.1 helix-turn-helix transcriptional regulator [Curtobacterium sp. VKM Ac-1395]
MNDSDSAIEARAEALVEDHERLLRDLVKHRKGHDLSQEVVAERMGVTQPTVAAFERYDANPTLATLRRYALAVGVRLHTDVDDDCVVHASNSTRGVEIVNVSFSPKPKFLYWVTAGREDRHDEWDMPSYDLAEIAVTSKLHSR